MSDLDRKVLFGNEAFAIAVLQAVSGASAAGAISQFDSLAKLAGRIPVLIFITFMVFTLVCAVLSAYFRHQYKMWDVRASGTRIKSEADQGFNWANRDLRRMRRSMTTAVIILCTGFLELVVSFWWDVVMTWVRSSSQSASF